jgi:hypothetical protein
MKYRDRLLYSLGSLLSENLNRRVFLVSEPQNGLSKVLFHDGNKVLFCGSFHDSEFLSPGFKEKVLMEVNASLETNSQFLQNQSMRPQIFRRHQLDR